MVLRGVSPVEPSIEQLMHWGANFGPMTLGGQWWRLFTAMFLHIGIVHIGLNMWCLLELGLVAEQILDPVTFLAAYLVTGLAGSVLSVTWHPFDVGAGASGAIFGLAGLLIALLYVRKVPTRFSIRARSLLLFVGYNLVLGLRPGVDNAAHVGGLAAGLALGLVLATKTLTQAGAAKLPGSEERAAKIQRNRYALVATALLLALTFSLVQKKNVYVVFAWKGSKAAEDHDWNQAERLLRVAAAERPSDPMVLVQLCYVFEEKQNPEAEACLKRAAELSPVSPYASVELGWFYNRAKRYQEARQIFTPLCSGAAESADTHLGLGVALQGLGDDHNAISQFLIASHLDPKMARAYESMASAQLHQHEYQDAITSLTEAERLDPNNPEVEGELGTAYQQSGRKEDAEAAFQRAIKLKSQAARP
jgi:membrane associated rhomboid family serine protease/Flp pilus assembly protein TadD